MSKQTSESQRSRKARMDSLEKTLEFVSLW